MRQTEYWRALLGAIILLLVLAFPQGIVGGFAALWRRAGQAMSVLAVRALSKSFGGVRAVSDVSFDGRRGRVPRHDRPERRRQIDLLQHDQRPACAGFRRDPASRARDIAGLAAARHLAARRRPHLPGRRDLRLDDGRRERADGADLARRRNLPAVAAGRRACIASARSICSRRSACARPPTGRAASSPMATSSASSSPSRSPTSRACC